MSQNIWSQHRDKLAGAWKTVSFEVFDGAGPDKKLVAKPHGDNPLGRVVITRDGFLSAHMAYPDRISKPLPSGKAWQVGDDAEVAHVARGLSMYCGHLQLFEDSEGLYWQTKVVISSDPNRQGGVEERRVQVFDEGGKTYMILQPKNDMVMHVSDALQLSHAETDRSSRMARRPEEYSYGRSLNSNGQVPPSCEVRSPKPSLPHGRLARLPIAVEMVRAT